MPTPHPHCRVLHAFLALLSLAGLAGLLSLILAEPIWLVAALGGVAIGVVAPTLLHRVQHARRREPAPGRPSDTPGHTLPDLAPRDVYDDPAPHPTPAAHRPAARTGWVYTAAACDYVTIAVIVGCLVAVWTSPPSPGAPQATPQAIAGFLGAGAFYVFTCYAHLSAARPRA